jgi:hypothetical protein
MPLWCPTGGRLERMTKLDEKKPHFGFLEFKGLPVSKCPLKEVGSTGHEISFLTPVDAPFRIPNRHGILLENAGRTWERGEYRLVQRSSRLGDLGILCSSATRSSPRETTWRHR